LVLVFGNWLGIWFNDACFTSFGYSQLGTKNKEIRKKIQLIINGNNHGKYLSKENVIIMCKKKSGEIKVYGNLSSYVW
jgi:hypothetical protein